MSFHAFRAHRALQVLVPSLHAAFIASLVALGVGVGGASARACDLCSTPSAPDAGPGLSIGLFEQYSDFGTMRDNGEEVADDVGQYLRSSVTQLVVGYRFSDRWAAHVVVPYIRRSFRRPEGFEIDEGVEQGLGDISVVASARVLSVGGDDVIVRIDDLIGLEFPTGRSARLGEEANEVVVPGAPESGVHGHDLAEGSGSWDVPLGIDAFARYGRGYLGVRAQYTIRNQGTHDYQYANDLTWNVTPGFDAWRDGASRFGIEANLTGEAKGKDVSNGEVAGDTGVVAVYVGPQVSVTLERRFLAVVGYDHPLVQNNTALQLMPDYRLHGGIVWAF